jgi:hypothetical protein
MGINMKIRSGFVSNSSSSSFMCDICGDIEEVYDGESEGWNQCVEGHTWHDNCFNFDGKENHNKVTGENCPICSMKYFTVNDLLKYLIIKTGKAKEQIETEIRKEFKNYDLFCVYLKRGNK